MKAKLFGFCREEYN